MGMIPSCVTKRETNMAFLSGTACIWFDTIGRIPIRIGIPIELSVPEAKAGLEEFLGFLADLAQFPNSDKISIEEAYQIAREMQNQGKLE